MEIWLEWNFVTVEICPSGNMTSGKMTRGNLPCGNMSGGNMSRGKKTYNQCCQGSYDQILVKVKRRDW